MVNESFRHDRGAAQPGHPRAALVLADISAAAFRQLLSLGVGRQDLHRYGSVEDHDRAHGLCPAGLRERVTRFTDPADPR